MKRTLASCKRTLPNSYKKNCQHQDPEVKPHHLWYAKKNRGSRIVEQVKGMDGVQSATSVNFLEMVPAYFTTLCWDGMRRFGEHLALGISSPCTRVLEYCNPHMHTRVLVPVRLERYFGVSFSDTSSCVLIKASASKLSRVQMRNAVRPLYSSARLS